MSYRIALYYCAAIFMPLAAVGQPKCNKLKSGKYYFYPQQSQQFLIIRKQSEQAEINLTTKDTSYWKIIWQSPCTFNMSFIRSTKAMSENDLDYFRSNTLNIQVLKVTKDYYTFKAGILNGLNTQTIIDTMWFKQK